MWGLLLIFTIYATYVRAILGKVLISLDIPHLCHLCEAIRLDLKIQNSLLTKMYTYDIITLNIKE